MIKIDNATLYNQDCLEFLKGVESESVSCLLIDEPYGILTGHKIEEGYSLDIALQVRKEAFRVLKKDGWFVFFSQFPNAWDFGRITFEAGFKPWQQCNEIVWCKRMAGNVFGKIGRIHENIFVFQKGNPQIYENSAPASDMLYSNYLHGLQDEQTLMSCIKEYEKIVKHARAGTYSRDIENITVHKSASGNDEFYNNINDIRTKTFEKTGKYAESYRWHHERRISSVFTFLPENKTNYNNKSGSQNGINIKHPTVKPTLLLRRLIKLFTQQDDLVLDCFSGSGTTAIACLQEGRHFIGCERDKTYFDNSIERLKNWKADLERQDNWLEKRGVKDFKSDVEVKKENKTLF